MSESYWLTMMVVFLVLTGISGWTLGTAWACRFDGMGFDTGERIAFGVCLFLALICVAGTALCAAQLR